jgi:DNA-binding NarL/FixJ family response regulator
MNKKIRLMLAQDNELFRKSLIALLRTKPEFEITGEARNGKELLEHLKQKETDIVLIDVEMPVMDGKMTLEVLQLRFPSIKVIVLSNQVSYSLTTEFMSRGASCYLTMNCGVDPLLKAIQTVNRDGYYFDDSISKAMLGALIKGKQASNGLTDVAFNEREIEIMKAVCDGKTNKEIAGSLHLSTSTIDFYKGKIYEKTNCNNAAGLLKYALKKGIVALT